VLAAFIQAFRTPDLRRKLLFTLGIIVVYRIGTHVPIPGVDYRSVQECVSQASGNPFGGTSILIIVGVGLETVRQIESQLQQRHYEGFLR
jgi:preprotein translocase subunit SecY